MSKSEAESGLSSAPPSRRWTGSTMCLLIGIFASCRGPAIGTALKEQMQANARLWRSTYAPAEPGSVLTLGAGPRGQGWRVIPLIWDDSRTVGVLLAQLRRVTYEELGLAALDVKVSANPRLRLSEIPDVERNLLRQLWEQRIVAAMTTAYFQTDKQLLLSGLADGSLTLQYLLVGRHSSSEMGYSDIVRFACTNTKGQLVSKIKEQYGCCYPLGFVDQTGSLSDVLF